MTSVIQKQKTSPMLEKLGKPRQEILVKRRTAEAYTVKAGEYIQVIDLEGKQCSDMVAFKSSDPSRDINNTVTRTLLGKAFPSPGEKFYALDFEPLLELVEDTVRRHDTFQTACNRQYYQALGYPNHPNCTDNFNEKLPKYGVKPRPIWEAVNWFFNTSVAADKQTIVVDQPLSKPGDYVLLRSETDLIMASSACPDDISPANAYNPTDILVRVFPAPRPGKNEKKS